MDQFYREGTLSVKQQLVGSMFPEKLIFENKAYRTIKENPVIPLTCRPRNGFKGLKNKKTGKNTGLSARAPPNLQVSNQLIEDLKLIYRLKPLLEERGWKMKE